MGDGGSELPRLTIELKRSQTATVSLPVFVRDVPGLLAPPPAAQPFAAYNVRPAEVDESAGGVEIDALALADLASLRTFLSQFQAAAPVRLWCWDARFPRLLAITDAGSGATTIVIDLDGE